MLDFVETDPFIFGYVSEFELSEIKTSRLARENCMCRVEDTWARIAFTPWLTPYFSNCTSNLRGAALIQLVFLFCYLLLFVLCNFEPVFNHVFR